MVSSHHMLSSWNKDESVSKDPIQETFSFIWDCQHRKGKFHLEQRNSRHRETAARFSKRNGPGCVCPLWRGEFIKFPWFQPFSQTLFFGMLFVSPLMCGCFLQGDMNCVDAAWWVYKNANHCCGKWFDIQPFVISAKVSTEVPRSMLWWRSRWRCFVPFPKIHTSLMFLFLDF